jgi:hypothetical protein
MSKSIPADNHFYTDESYITAYLWIYHNNEQIWTLRYCLTVLPDLSCTFESYRLNSFSWRQLRSDSVIYPMIGFLAALLQMNMKYDVSKLFTESWRCTAINNEWSLWRGKIIHFSYHDFFFQRNLFTVLLE